MVYLALYMVSYNGEQTVAWWQIDLKMGETVGVGEDGTHQFLVVLPPQLDLLRIVAKEVITLIGKLLAIGLRYGCGRKQLSQPGIIFGVRR